MDMCIDQDRTIEYYDNNAREYFDKSVSANMLNLYNRFLEFVPAGGSILDIGCGSGRDLKYFKEHGYRAEGLEASAELCSLAEEYSECSIYFSKLQEFKPVKRYDAIWACASLLHLSEDEMISFFKRIDQFLFPGSVAFISMKSGINTGFDEYGRYFTNFDEDILKKILKANGNLKAVCHWISNDSMNRQDTIWSNLVLRYVQ